MDYFKLNTLKNFILKQLISRLFIHITFIKILKAACMIDIILWDATRGSKECSSN